MSRRRRPRTPVTPTAAPHDGTALGHVSEAQLLAELARRRLGQGPVDMDAIESFAEGAQRELGEETLAAAIAALPPEDGSPTPCPRCGKAVPVKARNRPRHILTVAGELRLTRNYHHCKACNEGFYPRDRELKLPEKGEVSEAMERRLLDFGVNDTFEAAAERWALHYPFPVSANLLRRVVDRAGEYSERAFSPLSLQCACRPVPEEPPRALVVAGDGSMLLTREESWKEAKVAVVARAEDFASQKGRRSVLQARYVAEFAQDEFRKALTAALEAERADEVMNVVWLGDGARENWKMAEELCPFAVQVLDVPHAVHNGVACGKVLLGEAHAALPAWEGRLKYLLEADSPEAAIQELLACIPLTETDEQLAALDKVVGYYRANEKRMRYTHFKQMGLPIGSGIVESAHRHVLQVRMKRAGQRWSLRRARQMARLRAVYRTAGPARFHWALRQGIEAPVVPTAVSRPLPSAPRRVARRYTPARNSPLNRAAASI